MFKEINALPRPQCHPTIVDWYRERNIGEGSFDMGGHVIRSFTGMLEP